MPQQLLPAIVLLAAVGALTAQAQSYTVLYSFQGGTDGKNPEAGLIRDPAGNLYGTTYKGGAANLGVIFKLDPTGHQTVLHSFTSAPDGAWPCAPLVRDPAGRLYGTAAYGGLAACGVPEPGIPAGCGVVFRIDAAGNETVLHRFAGTDGANPNGGLALSAGGLAGVTSNAGGAATTTCNLDFTGCGVAFTIDPSGRESTLYNFTGGVDGGPPSSSLVRDAAGNLYGVTANGGASGQGAVFKIDPAGIETVLYSFTGGADGGVPQGSLLRDTAGILYGTAYTGGLSTCAPLGCGLVFKLDTAGRETVLYNFTGGPDGSNPHTGVISDPSGNLYGTTYLGGAAGPPSGYGTIFKIDTSGRETTLYRFNGAQGAYPSALIRDRAGNLYGTTTLGGGNASGVVFKFSPQH